MNDFSERTEMLLPQPAEALGALLGVPVLLTHGPLQALAMAEAARAAGFRGDQHDGRLRFDYRLTSPLFDFQGMVVRATREQDAMVTAVHDIRRRQTAAGTLRISRSSPINQDSEERTRGPALQRCAGSLSRPHPSPRAVA
jgi:hypothetical protein